jgi:nitrogen regulatory protein P-II 1
VRVSTALCPLRSDRGISTEWPRIAKRGANENCAAGCRGYNDEVRHVKEIKAYIQRSSVNDVVDALERVGAPGITIVEIHPVGYGYEPNYFEMQFDDAYKRYAYLRVVKLEVVCADRDLGRLLEVVRKTSYSGIKGDGMIFVSEVCTAVRIRNGACGEQAL